MANQSGLHLPPKFLRHNQADAEWLGSLPDRLAGLAADWSLSLQPHFAEIEINYVAPATRADGTPCVLKVSRHVGETSTEIAALQLWDGLGAARLLEAAPEGGALLLERLTPGTTLVEMADADDDRATLIAAILLRQLWRPSGASSSLRPLLSWCAAYDRNRQALSDGAGGFPAHLFQRADALRGELLVSSDRPVALHGDLHHFNILSAQRADWLAIDPKGLFGDRCFDVCQFLKNPREVPIEVNRRRLDVLCGELDLDRKRARDWCLVHAVLDACWSFEAGHPWHLAARYAEDTLLL
ncbi:MAG: aminoglycoside phosphotransferase family protein [Chloroflexota bacterium]